MACLLATQTLPQSASALNYFYPPANAGTDKITAGGTDKIPRAAAFPRYDLEVDVNPDQHHLDGRGTLWVPAAKEPREVIKIGLGKNMRDLVVEVIEPAESAGAIKLEPQAPLGANDVWNARPAKPFPAGRPLRLRFTWQGGEKSSFVFYLGPEGSFTSGINTAWYPVLESGLATGTLRINVPAGLTVHANGLQRGSAEERARGVFRYDCAAPSFFSFVAGKYTVTRHEGTIPVSVYLLKPRPSVQEYVEGSRKTIEVLSQEFGAYPSGEFAIVEVPEKQAGDAGFTGASVASFIMVTGSFLDQKFNLAYYGHEIAHQWWGNLIRRTGPRGRMMLDEAMAQYGSLRVVETLEGAEAAEQYRRTGYPNYYDSQSGLGYLKVLAAGKDFPLSNIPQDADRSIPDGKGFQVWEILSRTLGRENFRRILRDFTAKHAFQRVTWEEFLQAVERGTGRNLQWFYDQWFERPGVPEWQLTWRQEGATVRGEITQAPPYFRATLDVEAASRDGLKQSVAVEVDGPKTEFTIPLKFPAQNVVLDPHFRVLRWTPEYRAIVVQHPLLSDAENNLFDQEKALVDAIKQSSRAELEKLLAGDFRQMEMLDWSEPTYKASWIDNALRNFSSRLKAADVTFTKTNVKLYGEVGIVNTMFTIRETANGKKNEISYALLDVWRKDTAGWQLLTRYLEKVPAKINVTR